MLCARASPAPPLTVYYDDGCGLCRGSVRFAERRDGDGRLDAHGLSSTETPFAREDVVRELHAVDAAGVVYRGYDAAVAILATTPRWRVLAPLLRSPPVARAGGPAYRFVARHRRG